MRTVLLIDDEECARDLVAAVLEDSEFRVVEARDGAAGLTLAQQENPDVILLDFLMPGLSGVQILQRLKAATNTAVIPVVLMSGVGADEGLFRSLAYDAAAYLMKPFTPGQLLQTLHYVCNSGRYLFTSAAPASEEKGLIARLTEAVGDFCT